MRTHEEIKAKFRAGRHAIALRACEELCRSQPQDVEAKRLNALMHGLTGNFAASAGYLKEIVALNGTDADAIFNLGVCAREQQDFAEAARHYGRYTELFPQQWEGWANLAECQVRLNNFEQSLRSANEALKLNSAATEAWIAQGDALQGLKRYADALKSYQAANQIKPSPAAFLKAGLILTQFKRNEEAVACCNQALKLDAGLLAAHSCRADALNHLGRYEEAMSDYRVVLKHNPGDDAVLKKASVCLVNAGRARDALQLCQNALQVRPDSVTAKTGISWVLDQMVPNWHIPMMNSFDRNNAYYLGMKAAVTPETRVFEIGAGSGLLSMMAAKLGARSVVACEAVTLIAETAQKIVACNNLQDSVKVLARPSFEVELGQDFPAKADILVHEIFSSELTSEHVLPALEDAKRRLLKPDAKIIPGAASIMIALVGGEAIKKYMHVQESFGLDLQAFNAISPKKIPLFCEDLKPTLMSEDIEAFRFDFVKDAEFPCQTKTLEITAQAAGECYGIIQWIRLELDAATTFQNHPLGNETVSGWQNMVIRFDAPLELVPGQIVRIAAAHDRVKPWFELIGQ